MRIAIDAMGGDNAPDEIISGALESIELLGEDSPHAQPFGETFQAAAHGLDLLRAAPACLRTNVSGALADRREILDGSGGGVVDDLGGDRELFVTPQTELVSRARARRRWRCTSGRSVLPSAENHQ